METIKNSFKAALARKEKLIGLWMALADPYAAEICAGAGYDALVIDGEHAPNGLRDMLAQLQALAAYPVHPIVRPVIGDVNWIKQILDIGAQTLIVPMVESAEQAQHLVRATRYPPWGIRGVGSAIARASRWNRQAKYLQEADDQICLIVQIETKKALDNLEAIAAVDGVDGLLIGPADLSSSLGHRGNPGHPEVQATIDSAIQCIAKAGKAPCILTTQVPAAKKHFELGCNFIAVGVDTSLLVQATTELAKQFKGQ
jgi:4-hydroxy-2-oxoheptanedioate aldolase